MVSAGSRGTTLSGAPKASQHPPSLNAGKPKANELLSSGGSTQPTNRCPAPGAGCAPLPTFTSLTGEQAALGSRQLGPPEGGVTYTAALAGPVAPSQTSGSLKPTVMDSDMSKPAVSSETANRRMSCDMSWPLSDMPDGATTRWPTPTCRQESVLTRRPFLFQVFETPVPSWPGCGHPALPA